jgi:hypothetical protein
MSLDKKEKPLGLKITELIVFNFVWYSIFSLIYFDLNPFNWWLLTSIWGRVILIVLEYGMIMSAFNNKNGKD